MYFVWPVNILISNYVPDFDPNNHINNCKSSIHKYKATQGHKYTTSQLPNVMTTNYITSLLETNNVITTRFTRRQDGEEKSRLPHQIQLI